MKNGDRVRIVAIPDELPPDGGPGDLETGRLFQRCLGRVFVVAGFNEFSHVELEAGEVNGRAAYTESIWIEPHCLVVVENES